MSTSGPTDPLVASLAMRRASPAAEYRRQWKSGGQPQLDRFLASRDPMTLAELTAVVRVDLRERWFVGHPTTAEEYFARFAALQSDEESAVDVIYTEFLAREQAGEQPEVSEFQERFPAFAEALANQIELHLALDELEE